MRDYFEGFEAKLETISPEVSILTWQRPDTQEYSIRVVMDGNHAYLTGDLGTAVIEMSGPITLKTLKGFYNSHDYFMEKLKITTDRYHYDFAEASRRLNEEINKLSQNMDEDERSLLLEAGEGLIEGFDPYTDGLGASSYAVGEWTNFQPFEDAEWLFTAGRHLSCRVRLWLEAFRRAYEQLENKEEK